MVHLSKSVVEQAGQVTCGLGVVVVHEGQEGQGVILIPGLSHGGHVVDTSPWQTTRGHGPPLMMGQSCRIS